MSLLDDHIRRFNEGVRNGDFGPMVEGFTEDAELHFEGVPAGPFAGRDAIAAAYLEQPPDDEVEILGVEDRDDGVVVAGYAWKRDDGKQAGEMTEYDFPFFANSRVLSLKGRGSSRLFARLGE